MSRVASKDPITEEFWGQHQTVINPTFWEFLDVLLPLDFVMAARSNQHWDWDRASPSQFIGSSHSPIQLTSIMKLRQEPTLGH